MSKKYFKFTEKQVDLVASILNSLIERLPQDEYNFDDHYVGYYEDDYGNLKMGCMNDELTPHLEWILKDVINQVCKPMEKKND